MINFKSTCQLITSYMTKCGIAALIYFLPHISQAVNFTPLPPYLSETKGAPMVMLNLSRDHQLFYKAYNEYSDLDGDGIPETQYLHSYRYYGYFDNRRCYTYSSAENRFVPSRKENGASSATPTYCGGNDEWHGNFLNWSTMTRMDVVRRILYGGYRSTDASIVNGTSLTVLERAHLPTDAHSFVKYFSSSATTMRGLTPFSITEISICNRSPKNNQYSHNAIGVPQMLVASGNFSLWNSNERWQCYWSEEKATSNGNVVASSGSNASASNPSRATAGQGSGSTTGTYTVRVEVCKTGLDSAPTGTTGFTDDEESRCKYYPRGNYKPAGLLQKYGEKNEAAFGLITGSFNKNISGGVLRKNIATFTDEVDLDDGQFTLVDGIVKNLNNLRIYGYDYNDGSYISADNCSYQLIGLTEGSCTSWGNPMGEMYLEALRYLAGKSATSDFATSGGKDGALGLTVAAWSDPFASSTVSSFGDPLCRRSSIVNFNASVTSYDNGQWSGASDINLPSGQTISNLTDGIGSAEGLYATGKKWAVGITDTSSTEICNDKTMTVLSSATGICPEAPTYAGGYKIAGAALHAHTRPIRSDFTIPSNNNRAFKVDTYAVALATGSPRIKVAVPRQTNKFVIIQPAYQLKLSSGIGGGTLVDFRIVSQTATSGKYLVQWEDSEQGGDYDQDVWGTLEYSVDDSVNPPTISISTQTIAQATANPQGFGYVISGTNGKDGVHFHSGILNFSFNDTTNITVTPTANLNASGGCNNCNVNNAKTTAVYDMTGTSGEVLREPMWYAAKYGGFDRDAATTYNGASAIAGTALPTAAWDSKTTAGATATDGIPDNYFYAIDPGQLEKSLEQIFATILKAGGAAPAAATSSRTAAGGYVYVSTHSIKAASPGNDSDASGEFLRYSFLADGSIAGSPDWDAGTKLTVQSDNTGWDTNRKIFTLTDTGPVPFRFDNLSASHKNALKLNPDLNTLDSDARAQQRLEWLRGSSANETTAGGLRKRTKTKLGAIINSTPWYVGPPSAGYTNTEYGGGYGTFRTTYATRNTVVVAANDGMVHAFDGATGLEQFAYVPRTLYTTSSTAPYSKLSALSAKDFSLNTGTNRLTADGSVMAADINLGDSATPNWKTYVFGSFGRGAKGVYALDVTNPSAITTENTTNASTLVKWEFTEAADNDMGHIVGRTNSRGNGQPFQVGKMANGKWAAIYGNGYNSANGNAALFIIFANGPATPQSTTWPADANTGPRYIKLATGTAGQGPDNGLAAPTAMDIDNDGIIDYVYAGDLKGNVWKFDVRNVDPTNWGVATTGSVPTYQATAVVPTTSATVPQPITTAVVPFAHPQGGYQLFFGTGKALESTDYPMTVVHPQTLYGIWDQPGLTGTVTTGKSDLVQKTILTTTDARYVSVSTVTYPTKKGWYVNLPASSEGVVFNSIAEDEYRVNVRSLAPEATTDGCRFDATTYDFSLNPISGNATSNVLPTAPLVSGYSAAGKASSNTFEYSKGGIFKVPSPVLSTTACTAGTANCLCNPASGSCLLCTNTSTCLMPWDNGTLACTSGSANCACNPDNSSQCFVCTNPQTCSLPWKSTGTNQCTYRTIVALGTGGVEASTRNGICPDGRLTWREIQRNR